MQNTITQAALYRTQHPLLLQRVSDLFTSCKKYSCRINMRPMAFPVLYGHSLHHCHLWAWESGLFHENLMERNDFSHIQITSACFCLASAAPNILLPTTLSSKAKQVLVYFYDSAFLLEQSHRRGCLCFVILKIGSDAELNQTFNPFLINNFFILTL